MLDERSQRPTMALPFMNLDKRAEETCKRTHKETGQVENDDDDDDDMINWELISFVASQRSHNNKSRSNNNLYVDLSLLDLLACRTRAR